MIFESVMDKGLSNCRTSEVASNINEGVGVKGGNMERTVGNDAEVNR